MVRTVRHSLLVLLVAIAATLAASPSASSAQSVSLSWQPTPAQFWAADHAAITSLFHNGQCTMWAQERRPDVVRAGVEALISRELAHHQTEFAGNWNADHWPAMAHLARLPTGHVPRAHALMVFQPGVLGAGSTGHIAYVEKVDGDGSFEISQMHAPVLWRVTHQRLTAADGRLRGVTFIY